MQHDRTAAIETWWLTIDTEQREELMWSTAGQILSADQAAGMEEAGVTLTGRPRPNDIDLQYTLPADVAEFIAEHA